MRRKPRAFAAQRVFDDLHHHGLPFKQHVLDGLGRRRFFILLWSWRDGLRHIGHMQKGRALQPNVDKGRLHARQHAHDLAQIDIAHQTALQGAFDVDFLHHALFDDGGAGFLGRPVDQYFLLHAAYFPL